MGGVIIWRHYAKANETVVGEAIRKAMRDFNIPQRGHFPYHETWVRVVNPRLLLPSDLLSRDHFDAEKAFKEGWKSLVVEYIDTYLMH